LEGSGKAESIEFRKDLVSAGASGCYVSGMVLADIVDWNFRKDVVFCSSQKLAFLLAGRILVCNLTFKLRNSSITV